MPPTTSIQQISNFACSEDGTLQSLCLGCGEDRMTVPLRKGEWSGPRWYGIWEGREQTVTLAPVEAGAVRFTGAGGTLSFSLEYRSVDDGLAIVAAIRNQGTAPFQPVKAGIRLGIDTYMEKHPDWDEKLFPSLLRCEKTHFWGYLMSPLGQILGVASPDPIASWSLDYPVVYYGEERHGGHRINNINLDLLNARPLPLRHPQHLDTLAPGEEKRWTIYLTPCRNLDELKPKLAGLCQAPMFALDRHALAEGETTTVDVWSQQEVILQATDPDGGTTQLKCIKRDDNRQSFHVAPSNGCGVYTLTASVPDGRQSEAKLYVRRSWSWYLQQARAEAVRMPQKATTNMESWLGCFSAFLARKHFPDPDLDAKAEANFREILPLMFDVQKGAPTLIPHRIQNPAAMIGLLADLFQVTGDMRDLDLAARLADWLTLNQHTEGAYRTNLGKGVHYTSVTYLAKYMLELVEVERELAAKSDLWRQRYERHLESARRAIDDLERRRDNVETEGEQTFEDGMISCTAMQLALFATWQNDPSLREKYAAAARSLMARHRCLQQVLIPDCRMIGGTLRFWETQYDVLMTPNMMNSPHGWSSWKTYATWYLYLLTGEEHWLCETMDALGSAVQMIDLKTGVLRWGFVPDPYVPAREFQPDNEHPGQGIHRDTIVGEQYVAMLSDWFQAPKGKATGGHWDQGGCCDNDVHEHFKCLEEVALTSAYVIERKDGSLGAWNCRVEHRDHALHIHPQEPIVSAIHINLPHPREVMVHFANALTRKFTAVGLQWLRREPAQPVPAR